MPKTIKIKEINGVETYKDGRQKLSEIHACESGYRCFYAFTRAGCVSADYPDLATARAATEKYIRGLYFGEVVFVAG